MYKLKTVVKLIIATMLADKGRKRTRMKTRIAIMTANVAIIGLLLGCGGSVSLVNVWTDPGYHGDKIDKILVVGMAPREQTRSTFEYQLTHEFNSYRRGRG